MNETIARLPGDAAVSVDGRLLGIAADHLTRFGLRRLTVVGIAEEAGMTHANVYRYFASKTALIDAVVGLWLSRLEASAHLIADAVDAPGDKLERIIRTVAQGHRDILMRDANLFTAYMQAVERSRPVVRRHRGRMHRLLERVIDEGMSAGVFRLRDRERATTYIGDASYRFNNPVPVHLDRHMPRDHFEARLAAAISGIRTALATGVV